MESQSKKFHYLGHRQRLVGRFAINCSCIQNYELIEMLLFYVFKQKDTKPLAKNLLDRFKSLRAMVSADPTDLSKIEGAGESTVKLISIIHEIFKRIAFEKLSDAVYIKSTSQVIEYYKDIFSNTKKEQLRVIFLNNSNQLISEELIQEGTLDKTPIYPREIIQKALNYVAGAIIIVHNHPSDCNDPSPQDIIITKQIMEISKKLDIELLDHIIVCKSEIISFKKLRII